MSSVVSNESVLATHAEVLAGEQSTTVNRGIPRWADALFAFVGLALTAPILALCAASIAITSGLPVFFRQSRVGRGGRMFRIVKLRTMKQSGGGPQITRKDDLRITPVGKLLRRTKLDELPTLWNVLRGDMALVGPRPEVPRYVKLNDPLWQTILKVRPGITDPVTIWLRNEEELLAQVVGDSESYYVEELQPQKLLGYVKYLQRRSIGSDIQVLWRTVAEIFRVRR